MAVNAQTIQIARDNGYNDAQIRDYIVNSPEYSQAKQAGYGDSDIFNHLGFKPSGAQADSAFTTGKTNFREAQRALAGSPDWKAATPAEKQKMMGDLMQGYGMNKPAAGEVKPAREGAIGAVKDYVDYLSTPTEPAQNVTDWATRVVPESTAKTAYGMLTAPYHMVKNVTDPIIDYAANITNPDISRSTLSQGLEKGMQTNIKGAAAFMGKPLGFAEDEKGNINWSPSNIKQALLTDPVGTALAAVPIAKPGLKLTSDALKGGTNAVVDTAAGILGTTTGTGANYVRQAVKAGYEGQPEFAKYMRGGEEGGAEIVQAAKGALQQLRDQRGEEYRAKLENIAATNDAKMLDITPIQNQWEGFKKKFGIRYDNEGNLDLSRSTLSNKERGDIQEINDLMNGWGKESKDLTPLGLDLLKRKLDNLYTESRDSRAIVSGLRDTTKKTILNSVPEYEDMVKGYEDSTKLINELDRTLSLGKKPMIDTTMRKLTQSMRDNFQFRKELLDTLSEMTGENLQSMIAGYNMSSWQPQGGFGKLTSLGVVGGTAAHVLTPAYLAGLVTASPRLVGESLRALGITGRAAKTIIDRMPDIRATLNDQRGLIGPDINADSDQPLKPATIRKGEVWTAPAGKTHYDVNTKAAGIAYDPNTQQPSGFVTPDGKYLDRKQSIEWLRENRPEVYRRLNVYTKKNGLESQDYAHAEGLRTEEDAAMRDFMRRQFGR